MDFESFFQAATGCRPYGYQARIARDGLPDALTAPTGTGKTGVILAWLWRLLYGRGPAVTPRRLIYALPPGWLADSAGARVREWLTRLELTEQVGLHVAMGPWGENLGDWRENMHRPAIVIGNSDVLVSKALNRGFGTGRALSPIDFCLVTNGAQWIVEEARLCPQATATLRRLAGWAGEGETAEPFGITLLSSLTETEPIGIAPGERAGELACRLGARRTIRRAPAEPGDYRTVARLAAARHRPGTITLVVLNTVPAAQTVHRLLRGEGVTRTLLHPRLRGIERAARLADIAAPGEDMIVVTAQVAEGLDLSAAVLVTEAAPWPALVRRAGRCNRDGAVPDAELWWLPQAGDHDDSAAACAELNAFEGTAVSTEDLAARAVPSGSSGSRQVAAIGREAFAELFDTTAEIDVSAYLLDGDDLDVELAWATWTPGPDGAPDAEVRYPPVEYRCRVPIGDAVRLAGQRPVWRLDRSADRWLRLGEDPGTPPRPLELLLVNAVDGGYDPETGFDPAAPGRVPDSPELLTPGEITERAAAEATAPAEPPRPWQSLAEHSDQVRDQAAALLAVLAPRIPPDAARATIVAAHLHDAGKAHPVWQDALCALAEESEAAAIAAGRPWAKSGKNGRLEFAGGAGFRHELASLLLLDGPLAVLLAASPDPDLTRYLVLAHHGLLRVQVRDSVASPVAADDMAPPLTAFGLAHGAQAPIPAIFGRPASTLVTDLAQFGPDGGGIWQQTVLRLLARYGPVTLAYLETIVRVADWRASGGNDLPADPGNDQRR